jgi:drug/metabolite transporter (DMT)-like permease
MASLFWSTTIAFSRSLTEHLGTLTAAACIYLVSGALGCAYLIWIARGLGRVLRSSGLYLFGCGACFVAYSALLYLAIGMARGRQQAIEVGIINYLWPSLTLVLSIPILGHRGRWTFVPGVVLALGGAVLATVQRVEFSVQELLENLRTNQVPYVLALAAAITWAAYSNLSRRWTRGEAGGAVPIFLLASGVVLLAMRLFVQEDPQWSLRTGVELMYMAAFPGMLAYIFWEAAMRKGRMVLVASVAYAIPLLSTIISCVYLDVAMGLELWLACAMVIAGAAICKRSIVE